MRTKAAAASLFVATLLVVSSSADAITITFDYSKDANGFFTDPARRALLDQAAATFTGFTDSLAAITPSQFSSLASRSNRATIASGVGAFSAK